MKDKEFIELLNLYLDHEISVSDAARLEAEVQRDPARYRVYRDYCQLHKACTLLSPSHASEAPVVATFESRSRAWMNPFAIGGVLAAAAAVAFVFLNRAPTPSSVSNGSAIAMETPAGPVPSTGEPTSSRSGAQTGAVSISPARADYQQPLVTQSLRWNPNELEGPTAQDARLNWIETLQLASVHQASAESLRFETKTTTKDAQRGFGPGATEGATEYNAIQFQR